jgi:hypothetical protein
MTLVAGCRVRVVKSDPPAAAPWMIDRDATVLEVVGDHVQVAFDEYVCDERSTQIAPWIHQRGLELA